MKKITQEMLNSMSEKELKKLTDEELASLVGLKIGKYTLIKFLPVYYEKSGKRKGYLVAEREAPYRWSNLIKILVNKHKKIEEASCSDLPEDSDIHDVKASPMQKYIDIVESDDTERTALLIISVKLSLVKILDKIAEDNFIDSTSLARSAIVNMVKEYEQELEEENKKSDLDLTSEEIDEALELRRTKNREYYQKNKAKYAEYNLRYWAKQAKLFRDNKEVSK